MQKFREWATLEPFLSKIPKKYLHGFIPKDLLLTCLTCSCDSLVAGSNAGLIFWYDRSTQRQTKYRIDEHLSPITSLSLTLSQFGEVLAVGNFQGTVAIFCLNKTKSKAVFVLYKVHLFAVTSLAWDSNGQRLLTGDDRGRIILSQFKDDQLQPLGKLVNESTAIIQLRFHPLLANCVLASTYNRTVVITFDKQVEVTPVGEEPRKILAPYGSDFGHFDNDLAIFQSQPGLNLLVTDLKCRALRSIPFKTAVNQPIPRTCLLSNVEECWDLKLHFGPLLSLSNNLIVTYSPAGLFVLEPQENAVISCCRFKMSLKQVAVFHDEIFLLVEGRVIIRLSQRPDHYTISSVDRPLTTSSTSARDFLLKNPVPSLQSAFSKLANKVSDLELHTIKNKSIRGMNHGPLLLESLSNALGPIFSSEAKEEPNQKIITEDFAKSNKLPATPVTPRTFPVCEVQAKLPIADTVINEDEKSYCLTPPYSESGSSTKSHMDDSLTAEDTEELVYATVRGKDRRMRLNKKKAQPNFLTSPEKRQPLSFAQASENYNKKAEVDTEHFRQELERKEKLLAQLLNLDEILSSSSEKQGSSPKDHDVTDILVPCDTDQADQAETQSNDLVVEESFQPSAEDEVPDEDDFYSKYYTEDLSPPNNEEIISNYDLEEGKYFNSDVKATVWLNSTLPCRNPLANFAVCDNYVFCVEKNKVTFGRVAITPPRWHHVDYQVDYLAVSSSGRFMWKIYKGIAYQGDGVNHACPYAEDWIAVADKVISIALDEPEFRSWTANDSRAWLLHCDGSLACRSISNPSGARTVQVPSPVKDVVSFKGVVWILLHDGSVYARSGVSSDNPLGMKWVKVNVPVGLVTSIGLSHSTAWIASSSKIFFMNHVTMDSPAGNCKWFQVDIPVTPVSPKPTSWNQVGTLLKSGLGLATEKHSSMYLAAHGEGVWIAIPDEQLIISGENINGFLWEKLNISIPNGWLDINVCGSYRSLGALWLLGLDEKLYGFRDGVVEEISLPCDDALSIAAAPNCLWMLTRQGRIFIRAGLGNSCPLGIGWTELCTAQFCGEIYPVSVSLGSEIAWACDNQGRIYMRTGSNESPDLPDLCPAWIHVDDDASTPKFVQVCTSPANFMVWAIDENNCVYVRQGIYVDLPIGVSWVKIDGVAAKRLALSESTVWVLATDGAIYRRLGITRSNFAGDVWQKIIGTASCITASVDDKLYAAAQLNSGWSVCLLHASSPMNDKNDWEQFSLTEDNAEEDWVII